MIKSLIGRACCNRCADHHRGQRDLGDYAQHVALLWSRGTSEERGRAGELIGEIAKRCIARAEKHYLLSGFQQHATELADTIRERPDYARYLMQETERGIAREAGR